MTALVLTEEEVRLITTRRKLFAERQKRQGAAPKNAVQQNSPKQANGWDAHGDPDRVHLGRLTEDHPLGWFEPEIFRKIGNTDHQAEHKKITNLLKMPVQTKSRDRVYHALCHLDVLWAEGRLPVKYKHLYEEYKKKHIIGDDNINPKHKENNVTYKLPQNKRSWNPENYKIYDKKEAFSPTKIYDYAKSA